MRRRADRIFCLYTSASGGLIVRGNSQACCPPKITLVSDSGRAEYHKAGPDQWLVSTAGQDSEAAVEAKRIVPFSGQDISIRTASGREDLERSRCTNSDLHILCFAQLENEPELYFFFAIGAISRA